MQLLARTQKIERELGRVRSVPKGPRTLDIDILLYGDAVIRTRDARDPAPADGRAPLRARAAGRSWRRTCGIRSRSSRFARCSPPRRRRRSGCYTRRSTVQDLYAALKRYWGYDTFRPMQERIIQSLLAGSDAAVVMPTGGGKSLCYQLPALALGQTVVVISPLIALMQDQVAQLARHGHSRRAAQQLAASRRAAQRHARRDAGRLPAAVSLARAAGAAGHHRLAAARAAGVLRHRRGALHFRMGTRVPPGVPPAQLAAAELPGQADRRLHRQRDPPRPPRHPAAAPAARAAQVHRELPPPQPALRGAPVREGRRTARCCWSGAAGV